VKKRTIYALAFTALGVVLSIALYFCIQSLNVQAQDDCCDPPIRPPAVPRFPQGARVTVYINTSSGFTGTETQAIRAGFENWNGQPNSSGITYNVVETSTPPAPGGANTLIVQYEDVVSNTAVAETKVYSQGTAVYMDIVYYKNIRLGVATYLPAFIRSVTRHEAGHGLGLDNADDCPPGSTIMRLGTGIEYFITDCDNGSVSSQPAYPSPTPTPTPCDFEGALYYGGGDIDCSLCTDGIDNDCNSATDFGDWHCGSCNPSPIVVDTLGDGFNLTSAADGVWFDIQATGHPLQIAWIQGDDAWLALDRNGNGLIDNGRELFGNFTFQPFPTNRNGFRALAEFDKPESGGNGNGAIDTRDAIFSSLRLWQDTNHNGVSEPAELHALASLQIDSISLKYKESKQVDEYCNEFRYRAKVDDAKHSHVGRWAWDVFLVH
jgi:hypothetical protein